MKNRGVNSSIFIFISLIPEMRKRNEKPECENGMRKRNEKPERLTSP